MADGALTAAIAGHPFARRPIPAVPEADAGRAFDPDDRRGDEPLVDLAGLGIAGRNHYARADGGNAPYHRRLPGAVDGLWLRAGAAAWLAAADADLRRHGLRLFVHDAWRPIAVQRAIFDHFRDRFARTMPGAAAIVAAARRYASDPSGFDPGDPGSWPPHCTGGAVDCGLMADGAIVDCGGGFDMDGPLAATAATEAAGTLAPVRQARRVLYWTMVEAGFSNYPAEWWHYDLGTRLHADRAGNAIPAWYGPAGPP